MSRRIRLLLLLLSASATIYFFQSSPIFSFSHHPPLPTPPPLPPVRTVVPNIKANARPFGDPKELGFKPVQPNSGDVRKKWKPAPPEDIIIKPYAPPLPPRPPRPAPPPTHDDNSDQALGQNKVQQIPAAQRKGKANVKAGAKKLRPKPKKVEPVLFMEDEEDDSEDHDGPHRNAVEGKDDDEGEGGDPAINYYEEQLNDAGRELDAAQNDGRVKKGSSNKLNKPLAGGAGKQRLDADLAPRKPGKDGKWGGGWSQRFKQKGGVGAAIGDETRKNPFLIQVDGPQVNKKPTKFVAPAEGILSHPLVARLASFDFSRSAPVPVEADPFKAPSKAKSDSKPYNITLCALIPSESRFLPEWLLYHRSLGIERFALYDTGISGAVGGEERDAVADLLESEGRGELAPSAEELKDRLGAFGSVSGGLDNKGQVWPERIAGLERWIEQGVVRFHWMQFKDTKRARSFHSSMLDHCTATYAPTSEWLLSLDVDEFLVMSTPVYGSTSPSFSTTSPSLSDVDQADELTWQYPLHELLQRETLKEAACIPVPQFRYRNVGIRTLDVGQHVLKMQTKRDVLVSTDILPEKTLLHTSFSPDFVSFDGPHSCKVDPDATLPDGVTKEIRNSQGSLLQTDGGYKSIRLPTEPLSIAHFLQRDLTDCNQKIAALDDPNSLHSKGRGTVLCEEHYMPSPAELASPDFVADERNRFLVRLPAEGTVVEDLRVRDSWPAKAAHAVLAAWEGQSPPNPREIELARSKVIMLSF